jgi:hypothetical protein
MEIWYAHKKNGYVGTEKTCADDADTGLTSVSG